MCYVEAGKLDVKFNANKFHIIRLGQMRGMYGCYISISGSSIQFVHELKYLGWYSVSATRLKISIHRMRVGFFQCFNSFLCNCHNFNESVLQYLVNTKCKPYLLYGVSGIIVNCQVYYIHLIVLCIGYIRLIFILSVLCIIILDSLKLFKMYITVRKLFGINVVLLLKVFRPSFHCSLSVSVLCLVCLSVCLCLFVTKVFFGE